MNYQIHEVENGTKIIVEADEAAIIVREDNKERIYLSEDDQQQTTYYTSNTKSLEESENGFSVVHNGNPDSIKVFSTQENPKSLTL